MCIPFITKLQELLTDRRQNISIIVHTNPDGDAIGSALGWYAVLKNIGFTDVSVIAPNSYASFLHWMPNNNIVINASEKPDLASDLISNAKIVFCLDFNGFRRVEQLQASLESTCAIKIMIDHHPQPENGFDLVFSDTNASSTAEMVYEVAEKLGYGDYINLEAAQCLYAGIVTDTGSFSYSCNNPRTYEITAELISKGVDGAALQSLIYNTYTLNRIRLLGYCLSEKLKVIENRKAAYISLAMTEMELYEHQEGDTEGFVNYALAIEGIEFAAFFFEKKDHVKVSLRSTGDFDVNNFARMHYNGGGHKNASGGKCYLELYDTIVQFEKIVKNSLNLT